MNLKYVISFLYLNDAFNVIFGKAGYLCFHINFLVSIVDSLNTFNRGVRD